ncbi:ParB/Srx family N-terminal domain-containing protein [Pseudomonas sp. Choline-02u-1]|uniref:ParB/Srx family N-terminal domain-containing protein n=1 Tax=Pseudomonas sp. Choline-02u-1 TaxID=2058307 RepID=UPI001C474CB4|nr:ParB/Srx family N-terminal domain-containing protein [Pseudomonas sp. Choline-02u-1]MBS5845146.1 hypothetical protein [Pseudomonas putida]
MKMDKMSRDIRSIPLDLIKLDQENVRFGNDVAQNQREAIDLLMADPDDARKLLKLAQHIAENGFDPTELQLVTPDGVGSFIVLEGNRRLTAVKLLQKPDLCPVEKLFKGFMTAHNQLGFDLPQELQCSVVSSRAEGDMWIELKHTGQNNGVGRVGWDSDIRDERRARQTGVESIGRQVRNLVKDNPQVFSPKSIADVYLIPVTTLTRLFSSAPAQKTFQLRVENKELTPLLPLEFIAPSVEFALDMFVSEGYNVNDIRSDDNRMRFVTHIPPELLPQKLFSGSLRPPSAGAPQSPNAPLAPIDPEAGLSTGLPQSPVPPVGGAAAPNPAGGVSGAPASPAQPAVPVKPGIRAKPLSRARKFLVPWSLDIPNNRINAIYRDLRKTLVVDDCPNAVAVTFRVFLEVSCDDFILRQTQLNDPVLRIDTQRPVKDGMGGDKLSMKIQSIAKHLESSGGLATPASKAIFKRATSFDSVGSVDHFNLFVHSSASAPVPSELKDIADEYRPLLEAIWN